MLGKNLRAHEVQLRSQQEQINAVNGLTRQLAETQIEMLTRFDQVRSEFLEMQSEISRTANRKSSDVRRIYRSDVSHLRTKTSKTSGVKSLTVGLNGWFGRERRFTLFSSALMKRIKASRSGVNHLKAGNFAPLSASDATVLKLSEQAAH